jgi:hypothetical protein
MRHLRDPQAFARSWTLVGNFSNPPEHFAQELTRKVNLTRKVTRDGGRDAIAACTLKMGRRAFRLYNAIAIAPC